MKLFQRKQYDNPVEKKLSVLRFWFFALAIFSLVIPLAVLYVMNMARGGKWFTMFVLQPSLIIFAIVLVILVVVYFVYRAIMMRQQK